MKQRVISAIIALIIFIPIFMIGGVVFNIACYVLTLLGLREFMKAKEKIKKFPDFIRFVTYIMVTLLYFECTLKTGDLLTFDCLNCLNYLMI